MWTQISLNDALRAFLNGQTVKVVYFTENTVLNLQDILQRFGASAVMFTEDAPQDAPQKYNPPDNATEAELVDWIVNGSASEPEPPKVTREKKQLDEAEKAYQSRKISDIGKLRSLRAAGWDVEKIAIEFGCSGQTVRNAMKREGIE